MPQPDASMPCPRCGEPMRLVHTQGIEPAQRHWTCDHRHGPGDTPCGGHLVTDAKTPLSVDDIKAGMTGHAVSVPNSLQRDTDAHVLNDMAVALSEHRDAWDYLSADEQSTLRAAACILGKLAEASDRAAQTEAENEARRKPLSTSSPRQRALQGFVLFTRNHDRQTVLERCRALDRYLKYRRNAGANIEKAVDQLCWADSPVETDRAWAALSYRVGYVWLYELTPPLSQRDFEQYWSDWKSSRQVRAAIDRALGQESEL